MECNCKQETRIKGLELIVSETKSDIKDIKDVLLPSEYHPDNGLIKKFDKMESRFDTVEKAILQIKNYVLAAVAIFGAILTVSEIIQIIKGV